MLDGEVQRRLARRVLERRLGSVPEEDAGHLRIGLPLPDPVQHRAPDIIALVDVGAALDQELHDAQVAAVEHHVPQRRATLAIDRHRARSGLQQGLRDSREPPMHLSVAPTQSRHGRVVQGRRCAAFHAFAAPSVIQTWIRLGCTTRIGAQGARYRCFIETSAIFKALGTRIDRENNELYTLADKG